MPTLVLSSIPLLLATPVWAGDGVLEINQTCAVQTGCFPGDAPGFPVEITASGSYALTSNLSAGDEDGIFLATTRVTLDFRGFSLLGQTVGSGNGNGISGAGSNGSFAGFAAIRNGIIRGARRSGIALRDATGVRVENMVIEFNGFWGVDVGAAARILGNTFSANGNQFAGSAVRTGDRAVIRDNSVSEDAGTGIEAGKASVISGNTSSANGRYGILAGEASTVTGNSVFENANDGIRCGGDASTVSNNTVSDNGGDGIRAGRGALVSENASYNNSGCGLSLFVTSYRGNVMFNNRTCIIDDRGPPVSTSASVNAGGNVCGPALCP